MTRFFVSPEELGSDNIQLVGDVLDIPKVKVDNLVKFKIINGQVLDYDYDEVLFIDENGSSEMNTIKKSFERHERVNENDKFFGVTAVLCEATKLNDIKCEVEGLKSKYCGIICVLLQILTA